MVYSAPIKRGSTASRVVVASGIELAGMLANQNPMAAYSHSKGEGLFQRTYEHSLRCGLTLRRPGKDVLPHT